MCHISQFFSTIVIDVQADMFASYWKIARDAKCQFWRDSATVTCDLIDVPLIEVNPEENCTREERTN